MFRFFALIAASIALISCQQPSANAQLDESDREEIREIVREYILENPEIIEEALIELQQRARQREFEAFYVAIEDNHDAIYDDERDPRLGPDNADVTIVEFMDYKCGYCRVAGEWVEDVRERYGDRVQFIFKEYPILGPESIEASRAALAAHNQGVELYERFHMALVSASGPLPGSRIDQLAELSGIDVEQMREDMADPAIMSHIGDVRRLGQVMGVTGTPFFIVNGAVIPGANTMGLENALQEALAE
ncbi:DsbA family protein [Maricaulis sp.]|uniref:DsbA family protein n=1 Tax=Maricaulis sp. TaxID=1486257 RepID=UPI002607F0C5|nr:DsbA family protein [Maricaulis sp.]